MNSISYSDIHGLTAAAGQKGPWIVATGLLRSIWERQPKRLTYDSLTHRCMGESKCSQKTS